MPQKCCRALPVHLAQKGCGERRAASGERRAASGVSGACHFDSTLTAHSAMCSLGLGPASTIYHLLALATVEQRRRYRRNENCTSGRSAPPTISHFVQAISLRCILQHLN